jgi:hypothetical protein
MKSCAYCGESFTASRSDKKYCRELCARRAYQKRRLADGRYKTYQQKNRERLTEYHQANRDRWYVDRTCVECGTTWRTHRKDAKYCSPECYGIGQSRKAKGRQLAIPLPQEPGLRQLFEQGRYDEALRSLLDRTEVLASGCRVMKTRPDVPYPTVRWSKTNKKPVHRLILWAKTKGSIEGWHAHHTCANSTCVEPDHIVPATAAENVGEMLARRTYEAEIEQLRQALAEAAPDHPLLQRTLPGPTNQTLGVYSQRAS